MQTAMMDALGCGLCRTAFDNVHGNTFESQPLDVRQARLKELDELTSHQVHGKHILLNRVINGMAHAE